MKSQNMSSDSASLRTAFARYFGSETDGVNLRQAIVDLPLPGIATFARAIIELPATGRIFFMGNGGSFDNARWMAGRCRANGLTASVPGQVDDYLTTALKGDYADIYRAGLERDRVGSDDIVVGISGSGNSPNIVAGLSYAKEHGATVFCLGGRDGGRMRPICGDDHALIGRNQCMEAIEDLHALMVILALEVRRGVPLDRAHREVLAAFDAFLSSANLDAVARVGAGLLATCERGGRTFILGPGLGANHIRADLGRGATNTLPIRGISAPECFTMNSAQATANDDGLDFLVADGLVKHDPKPSDFAVLCRLPGTETLLDHCREILDAAGTPWREIGDAGVDLRPFYRYDGEFAVAMLGHACGEVLRSALQELWRVRRLEGVALPGGAKKLGMAATLKLEGELRQAGTLANDEVLTFCYGAVFAALDPAKRGMQRCFY
jgi:D-sedoheptulose 7-phosphate isomerase